MSFRLCSPLQQSFIFNCMKLMDYKKKQWTVINVWLKEEYTHACKVLNAYGHQEQCAQMDAENLKKGEICVEDNHLRWLKAHVGYLGNECAVELAKEAITKGDPFLLPKPLSDLKAEIKSAALSIWQDNWDNGETGRSTHDIVPRVSNKPVGWNREEIMFVTGHGPLIPSSLQSSNT
ncbi:hypothetical protein AVEN_246419-1 [Araneus ventricosus]|uniref:RNase H type-1 domain-containing protein n=1 Tax=Araneus ventricosus TaxID=182803 RepID=A0A4Y2MR31_ARAVE|nr:hypothetical protein AVEN_246419-1 [Araneus ventricosus]